jgi:hypothetical protein
LICVCVCFERAVAGWWGAVMEVACVAWRKRAAVLVGGSMLACHTGAAAALLGTAVYAWRMT